MLPINAGHESANTIEAATDTAAQMTELGRSVPRL